jgi:hypothetical protein
MGRILVDRGAGAWFLVRFGPAGAQFRGAARHREPRDRAERQSSTWRGFGVAGAARAIDGAAQAYS